MLQCHINLIARKKDENSEEAVKRRKQRAKKRKQQMEKQIEENKVGNFQSAAYSVLLPKRRFNGQ